MYAPISGDGDDEYVELYNRTTNAVNVGGWAFVDGISFTNSLNTIIAPQGYLVVAKNVLATIATAHHAINRPLVLQAQLSGHGEEVCSKGRSCQY